MTWPTLIFLGLLILLALGIAMEVHAKKGRHRKLSDNRPDPSHVSPKALNTMASGSARNEGNIGLIDRQREAEAEKQRHRNSQRKRAEQDRRIETQKRIRPWDNHSGQRK